MAISGVTSGGATSTSQSTSKTTEINNRFTALLVAQLKNQDPMSPMDPTQMTGQMATLEQLSQMTQMKSAVDSLVSLLSNKGSESASGSVVDFLGKKVNVSKDAYTQQDTVDALIEKAGAYKLTIDGKKSVDVDLASGVQSFDLSNYITDTLSHKISLTDVNGNTIPLGINATVSEVYMNPARIKISTGEILSASNVIKVAS